jgi:hypothetical protein
MDELEIPLNSEKKAAHVIAVYSQHLRLLIERVLDTGDWREPDPVDNDRGLEIIAELRRQFGFVRGK